MVREVSLLYEDEFLFFHFVYAISTSFVLSG